MSETASNYKPSEVIKWLLVQIQPYWFSFLFIALLTFGGSLCSLGMTEGLRRLVNAAQLKSEPQVFQALYFTLAVVIVWLIINFLSTYLKASTNHNSIYTVQLKFYSHLTKTKEKDLQDYHSGDIINRLDHSAYRAIYQINTKMIEFLGNSFSVLLLIFYLNNLNTTLTLISVGLSIGLPLLLAPLSGLMRKQFDKINQSKANIQTEATDIIQGAETVRAYSLQERLIKKVFDIYETTYQLTKKSYKLQFLFNQVQHLVVFSGILTILGYGGYLAIQGKILIGSVVAFLISFEQLIFPISRLVNLWSELQDTISNGARVRELMILPCESNNSSSIAKTTSLHGIVFDNVSFSYKEDLQVLKNISFNAKPGLVTAFAGPSGSGKSTIIKLLLRLYELGSGTIFYNQREISSMNLESWRNKIAYVAQDSPVFTGTIKDNLYLGKKDATIAEMWEALEAANLYEVVKSLPNGIETLVGERGTGLSGGERQRLTIARALLRNPEILLLDEATSSLDNENERLVQESLEKLMRGRTTLVVAHRLSTIKKANQIVYLEDGKVVETGTYYELLELGGRFADMALGEQEAVISNA